jgi:uncharacterized repeat protein (TIGR01451 family)
MPVNTSSFVIDDVVKESNVFNRMFFSGKIQNKVSDEIPQQPNTTAALDTLGWTVNPNDTSNVLVDTTFMNTYAFFCEATGSIHYFVSQMAVNNTKIINNQGCEKEMIVEARSSIAGGKGVIDVYPYEYKPPVLLPSDFNLMIPQGYHVKNAVVKNGLRVNGVYVESDTVGLPFLENASGNVTFSAAALPAMNCIFRNNNAGNSTTFYIGDQENWRFITLKLLPDSCMVLPVVPSASTTAQITFHPQGSACLPGSGCTTLSDLVMNPPGNNLNTLSIKPHLQLTGVSNSNAPLRSDTLCWKNLTVQNTNTGNPNQTAADNVFIAIVGSTPHLSNWHFVTGGQTYAVAGNIIPVTPSLAKGASISGNLCATPVSCPIDSSKEFFNIHIGWNCGNYPAAPYDSTKICSYILTQLSYNKDTAAFDVTQKYYETPYTLCDTVSVWAPFNSKYLGYLYPDTVVLTNLKPNLQVVGAYMFYGNNHLTSASAQLTPTATNTVWITDADSIKKIGYAKGGYNNGRIMTIRFDLLPTCTFAGDTTLPDIVIFAHDFCNEMMSANAHKAMNSTFRMSTVQSACTDCWQITKTADRDSAAAVTDIVTYTITVCNNSANTQAGVLADVLPSGFVQTNSTLPGSVTLNSMQCATFTVSGYFTQSGSCFYNVASVTSPANTTWKDSVCVNVKPPCTDSTTFIIPHNTYSTTLNYRYDTLNVYIAGTLYVNDTLKFMRCKVLMDEKAQIVVQNGGYLDIDSSTVQGCLTMWRGITVEDLGELIIQEGSTVADGDTTVFANDKAKIKINNAYFRNFVLGVYIPPKAGALYNGTTLTVQQATFEFTSFKPNYTGQNPHGTKSQCGILLNDWIGTIGGGTQFVELNYFNNLHTGVVGIGSILTVKRSCFKNIYYDNFYNEPYRGTAITNVKGNSANTTKLTVLPEVWNYNTVDSSYRGIYTDGSDLTTSFIHIKNVTQGIYGTQTSFLQTSMVSNCTITTTGTGIFWVNNPQAKAMMATGNNIAVNCPVATGLYKRVSRGAIYVGETTLFKPVVYSISNNNITLNNAFYGIMSNATLNSKIKENMIRINQSSGNSYVTGIELNSNVNANVSCNTVKGDYAGGSAGITHGIYTMQSTQSYIGCNTTDSTFRGIFFGGSCLKTNIRGNELNNHFNGLYLNNQAIIGQQPHRGNAWYGPFGSFGAVNMNVFGVSGSKFYVDSMLSSVYFPAVNISGWFWKSSGNTYYCRQQPIPCNNSTPILLQLDSIDKMIAKGTLEFEDYAEENKAIAEEYLYRTLSEDSAMWQADSAYVSFMAENMNEPVAYLYDAEAYLKAAYQFDSVFVNLIESCKLQINQLVDSINSIDEWHKLNPDAAADSVMHLWNDRVNNLTQTINNLEQTRQAMVTNNITHAELKNNIVISGKIPELNTAFLNKMEIGFKESDGNLQYIRDNSAELLSIAQQCPYSGGNAVIRARVWLSMINDSIDYDDNAVCLQSGVYRLANKDTSQNIKPNEIKIIPNPANNKVTVELTGIEEGLCKIQIRNTLNEIVYDDVFDCKKQKYTVNVSDLRQGVYSISVNAVGKKSIINKLIIAR